MHTVIPAPVSRVDGEGGYPLVDSTTIGGHPELAGYLAEAVRMSTGLALTVAGHGDIELSISNGTDDGTGGYVLEVDGSGIRIEGNNPASVFSGIQTMLQLLPTVTSDEIVVPHTRIEDHPRFEYRGLMVDVARHFFGVDQIERIIDQMAALKLNHLHLHLSDDQGWRVAIDSWPELTRVGASTQAYGGGGGFYTKSDYRRIVAFAASRFITVVPEIDMPGHTNAVLASYPELNADGVAPEPYEGIEVGFSSLWIAGERTYDFIDDVLGELAALTPGPFIHLGGDESLATSPEDYRAFIARATAIGARHGKTVIGWHEMGQSRELPTGTIGQYWSFLTPQGGAADLTRSFVEQGGRIIMSPADAAYLDIKYDASTVLGLEWTGQPTSVRTAYEWDPAAIVPGVDEHHLLGVEACVWTETLVTVDDLDSMIFPRVVAAAEVAWSPAGPRDFEDFSERLAEYASRLDAANIRYTRADGVPWR